MSYKPLDLNRSNTIPKYIVDEKVDITSNILDETKQKEQRDKLSEMLTSGELGKITMNIGSKNSVEIGGRPTIIRPSDEKTSDIYKLDTKAFDTFALPGRPSAVTLSKTDKMKSKIIQKIPVQTISQEEPAKVESKPFAFLPGLMGRKVETPAASTTNHNTAGSNSPQTIDMNNNTIDTKADTKQPKKQEAMDETEAIMQNIKTGEDAINFFARYGGDTPVKFVYLVQVDDTKEFRPYDLVVAVLPTSHEIEHYIMSSAGITHMIPNERSDAMPVGVWMRQRMMFRILRQIPFYKYFLHRKMFNTWRSNVRFLLFAKQRRRVADRLFVARDSSCQPILDIKQQLLEIKAVQLINLDLRTCDKKYFEDSNQAQCQRANLSFEESLRKVITEVQSVISQVNNLQGLARDGKINRETGPEKVKSLVALREEKEERLILQQRAKQESQTLPDLIRYVDYMSVVTIVSLTIGTARRFYEELLKQRKNGIFETTIRFTDTGSGFSPTCEDMKVSLENLLELMVTTVGNVNRVSYLNSKATSNGPNIQAVIRDNREFQELGQKIQEQIGFDFERAEEHAQTFEVVRPIYDFNATWDFEAYREEQHDMASIKSMLEMIDDWNKELEKLRNKPIGILEVDSKRLKAELQPIREARMQEIKDYVKDLARDRTVQLLEHYRTCVAKISNKPAQLKDYAAFVSMYQGMRDEEKTLFKTVSTIDQMYNLLVQYEVVVPSEDIVRHEDLHEREVEYRKEIESASQFRENKETEMISLCEVNMTKLSDQIVQMSGTLDDAQFNGIDLFKEADKVIDELNAMGAKLESINSAVETYHSYQTMFHTENTNMDELAVCKQKWQGIFDTWSLIKRWNDKYNNYMGGEFRALEVEDIDKEVQVFFKESYGLHKKVNNKVTETLKDAVSDFKGLMPAILDLGNPNMLNRHFAKLFSAIGVKYYDDMSFTLETLIEGGIMNYKDLIGDTSGTASGEAQLDASMAKIRDGWENMKFIVLNHRDTHNLFILGSLEEIFTLLEDNQVTLMTMLGSRYIATIQEEVEEWAKKLATLSETLDEWLACQRNWMYLENIFGAEDIQKQLPAESQKFLIVDRSWKALMKKTHDEPLCVAALEPLESGLSLLDQFLMNNEALESIQKSLEEYLETKRMAFPRFYFLSNDELLEILSQTRDPHAVQPFMSKCFDAIKRIKFGEKKNASDILAFTDPQGEVVTLTEISKAEGPVETWLLAFEKGMRTTLYNLCKDAMEQYATDEAGAIDRAEWLWAYPAQVVIAIDQVQWTKAAQNALTAMETGTDMGAMKHFLEFSLTQINAMVDLVRTDLSKQQRTLMGALLTIDVHARDVTRAIVRKEIESTHDFEWTKQLRYYWDEEIDDVAARQTNTFFRYGYEYLGNGPRLVITPLTDLCYMTLTGALHMRLGGAPAGPAGTGKTETTKDLAKALAVYCVVFNCSDGLDFKIMGRFFSGLAQQGAWACFDEFNRIDIEVLSVIAQQILCIQQAIVKEAKEFDFEGQMIPLNMAFGVFITMNPGYAGRTELPDNLKALFRPVAMMVPDYRLIAEIILFSEGFANALPLSNKMSQLYALSSEQLSKQSHYDFGMRAVKSVLVAAGQLKRKEPETNEDILLIRAMRDSNVPKFLEQDLPLFGGIIKDLFPGIAVPFVDYGKLQLAIEKSLETEFLQMVPSFITKVIQVHETQLVRHGMMVVGESGSGKTTNLRTLASALGFLYEDKVVDKDGFYKIVDRLVLNPKSITAGQLYGEFNLLTNEWKDGIVPKLVRECVNALNEGSENRKWIIFDGPVDAVWIENMNTVLDDNKTLCLANSERIKLPGTLHMIFEVQDLKVASPATVSRCGMVYMEQIHVGIVSLVRTWGQTTLKEFCAVKSIKVIIAFIEEHLEAIIDFLRYNCKEKVPSSNIQLTSALLNLITAKLSAEEDPKEVSRNLDALNALLVWCFTWSIGANIVDESRPAFEAEVLKRFSGAVSKTGSYSLTVMDPYGCFIDFTENKAAKWSAITPSFTYDPNQSYFSILVPTNDTTRYRYIIDKLMNAGYNVLFMAETGVGKSVVINSFLNEMVATGKVASYVMGYSAQTKPANIRDVLESKLEKKRKNLLGPPSGKKFFLFIDDLNMPALETYGAQPPNELLRQIIDQEGFYDVNKLFFKNVQDIVTVAACAPPGGGRNEVSPRLLRQFSMIWLTNLSTDSMNKIFTSILKGFIRASIPEFSDVAEPMVKSSVHIYLRIQQELLPTPLKSHYTFNLRDLSKVFQGMLMVRPKHLESKDSILGLWCHESNRVFRDRLINVEDRDWFNKAVLDQLHTALGANEWEEEQFKDLIYGDYLTSGESKEYMLLDNMDKINSTLIESLEEYNITFPSRMDLVFFSDAIFHVSRIARVLCQPRGNALLVGVGGSGRQSLTRMAAFMAEMKVRSIEITRGYGMNEFHENLKEILLEAGGKNLPTVFLFSDTQIVTEGFLEDINNILNSGEVPNLFEADELEKIVAMVRPHAKAAGKVLTRDGVLQHFIYLVRENLHICLAMSPIGAGFRNRCRMFPSLVNCCTIDWFDPWPEDALFSVAHRMFSEQASLGIGDFVDNLSSMCNKMHRTVELETKNYFNELKRYNYTTPTSYLELIRLYVTVLQEQQGIISNNERRYRVGLEKLQETEVIVAKLEQELTDMQPVLEQAGKDTAALLIKVGEDQKVADEKAAVVNKEVEEANVVAAGVKEIADDCQADLDLAMPAFESAVKALSTLDKSSIQEMKAFNNPPEMVKFTMEAVCILFEAKPDWGEAKKLMSKMTFMDDLKKFDKDNIDKKVMKKVMKYFNDERFMPETVKSQSSAAMCLCMWVRAMVTYDKVAKNIEPKKAKLAEAEAKLKVTMDELKIKKDQLQEVLDNVASLQKLLKETEDKKAELEAQADKAKQQLVRAGKLIGGLGGEKVRWQESAVTLNASLTNLVGDMCLAAGCLAYLGPFTSQFRSRIVDQWIEACRSLEIPCSDFTLINALAEPVVVRKWQIDGLPADDFSCENGLMATRGRRWPLMVDPQGQANRWIRNTYAENNLQIIKLTEKDFLRTLENGIRYGAPVLLENVEEELDPSLEPVLLKQTFKKGGQVLLRLGDSDVPYSDEFTFMITTKLANPHYMPEVCIKVTIVNFTVTMKGLEDQLLVDVIKNERPDLEEKKDALVVSIANDQEQLLEIEEQILSMLANASGDILEDEELINALARSKTTSTAIKGRLEEAEKTTAMINETREGYRSVATRGSVIYFVVANLALVDPMYQYSLQYYKSLIKQRLEKTEKKKVLQERLDLLIDDITYSLYTNVCRGLFEKDKLLYSFMIAVKIRIQSGEVKDSEWQTFLVGVVPTEQALIEHPIPSQVVDAGVPEKSWNSAVALEADHAAFEGLSHHIEEFPDKWTNYFSGDTPHTDRLPGEWGNKLNSFQILMLMRCMREEKVLAAVGVYVLKCIGQTYTESPPFDLEGAYGDSDCVSPLIFILSPGADPTDYLLQLAESKGKGGAGLRIISLGQGQGPIAEKAIEQAQGTGDWVCLQNCHLAVSWLAKLEQIVESMQNNPDAVDQGFRLWLTSMPSTKFPVPVLQNGIKITNEPPRGLKANLTRTFLDINPEDFESSSKPSVYKKLVFATAFFNGIILERRKYGAVGWNIAYQWMNSDLKAAMTQVRMYVEEQDHVPWETLNVIVSAVTYGGRVTDAKDKRTIASILVSYFQEKLLDETYTFTEDGTYYAPKEGLFEDYLNYIKKLPQDDPPEVFGLHPNASITFQQKESKAIIDTATTTGGSGGGGGGGDDSNDSRVDEMASKTFDRMPPQYDLREAHDETFAKIGDAVNSLGVFLNQELIRFNEMMVVMKASLRELRRAIKGEVVMSSELEVMYNCFVFLKTPPKWEEAGYPCLKPLPAWIEDFFQRVEFMGTWLRQGPRVSYWLPGFFFPQGFMTAVKQTYSRKMHIAVDTLMIGCEVTPKLPEDLVDPPASGAYVYGLYMEAGRFDREKMVMQDMFPRKLFNLMPCIWLKPVITEEYHPENIYECPLYKTSLRAGTLSTTGHSTNFVVALPIPSMHAQEHWIRRGCAMLCMLDD